MMERTPDKRLFGILAFAFLTQVLLPVVPGRAELRNVKVGDRMPEFSLPDVKGGTFAYKHDRGRVLALAFLPTTQRRLERAIADMEAVVEALEKDAGRFDFVGVISGPAAIDFRQSRQAGSKLALPILLDGDYQFWGKLGVIAAPTVVIVGKDDVILWIKAGYGYDFLPVVRVHLEQALGIAQETSADDAQQVKAVENDTPAARLQRHLQMAKMLEKKGRLESAIAELQKAAALDPNSIEPALELGELFCRAGRNKEALDLTQKLKAVTAPDKARRLLISGWARRQMSELDAAEKLLLEATALDPKSARALFELGKTYQAKGQTEKAMKSYHTALALVFDELEGAKTSN